MADNEEDISPLFTSSDKAVVNGLGRSSNRNSYGLAITTTGTGHPNDEDNVTTASFPIKKIAFRHNRPTTTAADDCGNNDRPDSP
eukprot:CAMPEP_0183736836 /NCGR_PEP_ID=MMETSP0737-20130205/50394_1 /TAXON_ID=385413 /ORGANISM="Thalassiosira miniscula, Strain CCMP1093" /LENGTH=84 /DNA_ID=CAMNT_0025970953 /DNA_START=10 /DNA_END=260 /DNA_ORIENTATION=+